MNPATNKFESLVSAETRKRLQEVVADGGAVRVEVGHNVVIDEPRTGLVRPNGEPVPVHWSVFTVGELVIIKDYTFKVAYIGEGNILFEPVGPVILESGNAET